MSKIKVFLQITLAIVLITSSGIGFAQTDKRRAVVKATVTSPRIITTIAGGGTSLGDGGLASQAKVTNPNYVFVDRSDNIFFVEGSGSSRVRKIDAKTGIVTTIAGNGTNGYSGDGGPATEASMNDPRGVFVADNGNIYIGDATGRRVRKIDSVTGIITTIAGNGFATTSGDGGPATEAAIEFPTHIFLDKSENLFIPDPAANKIRRVDGKTGIITTIAGAGPRFGETGAGFSGDGGSATKAFISGVNGVTVDEKGDVYFGDGLNNRIRKIDAATGIINTVIGTGVAGFSGDGGKGTQAQLRNVRHIFRDAAGNIYISDNGNQRIRLVDVHTGIINTLAGDGKRGFNGDGMLAIKTSLNNPEGIFVDGSGNIYFADRSNNRVRKVTAAKPASGLRLELARLVSGQALDYKWKGTLDANGQVSMELAVDASGPFQRTGASGYYAARVVDPVSGNVVWEWNSIPINGGNEIALDLSIQVAANVLGEKPLATTASLTLNPNFPNPFNPETQISYQIMEQGEVQLVIYNALGQQVNTLVQESQEAGVYRVSWNGKDDLGRSVSSGVYFYQLTSNGLVETRRMLLLK